MKNARFIPSLTRLRLCLLPALAPLSKPFRKRRRLCCAVLKDDAPPEEMPQQSPGTLECCCYLHWYSRADYSCWCSSSPAGLILHQIEIGDEDEESESSDSESNDDLELSKVTKMRLLPSYAGKCSFLFLQMTTPISIEDVRREVKILKDLSNHNNLVKFYDACEDALNVYVVMEGGRYSEEDAKAIVIQILSVIAFCHLQGVVHHDLKPEALLQNATESMKESKFTNLKYSKVEIDEVQFEWAECMLDYI
ncbi:hypothetical protein ZIOFF_062365 [Zingiber officinale]|uniref:Protein kinase domain-containing protein n=1 Tax=Zingiber officinale TaxID=94328 RepID=A0A8J5KEI0_ZINOF|nr:hypothetical protein ZIOFF_062365 [Zingiber officinale]